MTYIRLTSDCRFFKATRSDDGVILTWNMSMNLTPYNKISLKEFQIGPLSHRRHDSLIEIYSNLIARTLYNPLRELATIRISRNSSFVDGIVVPGLFPEFSRIIENKIELND